MTPEQIKQTVAEIRELTDLSIELGTDDPSTARCAKLLEITDHLQKTIKAQDRVGSNTLLAVIKMTEERDQARRVAEKLRNDSERPGGGHTWLPWENR